MRKKRQGTEETDSGFDVRDIDIFNLSPAQETALAALLAGKQHQTAAQAAGVRAGQISRWLRDATFLAAYNHQRALLWEARQQRLQRLADQALDVLDSCMQDSANTQRAALALQVLKVVAVLPAPAGPQTPADVENEQRSQERMRLLLSL